MEDSWLLRLLLGSSRHLATSPLKCPLRLQLYSDNDLCQRQFSVLEVFIGPTCTEQEGLVNASLAANEFALLTPVASWHLYEAVHAADADGPHI
jgi:hypothetical protein